MRSTECGVQNDRTGDVNEKYYMDTTTEAEDIYVKI